MHSGLVSRPRPLWLPVLLAGFALLPASRAAGPGGPTVREFTVEAERFAFAPDRIEVNQGDTVRVTVRSTDVTHGFEIEEFDVDLYVHKSGRPATAEFVADRAGTFEITCSEYCGRGHSRMKGYLVVTPGGKS